MVKKETRGTGRQLEFDMSMQFSDCLCSLTEVFF